MKPLKDKIALVTGRSIVAKNVKGITKAGGKGIAVVCNHENDDE